MKEKDKTPDQLLQLKEAIITAFQALPPEHQATMSLSVFKIVTDGEWGTWVKDALSRLNMTETSSVGSFPTVTRDHLHHVAFSENEIGKLTDDELAAISRAMYTHYVSDLFWDEVQFHTANILDGKPATSDSACDLQSPFNETTGP